MHTDRQKSVKQNIRKENLNELLERNCIRGKFLMFVVNIKQEVIVIQH